MDNLLANFRCRVLSAWTSFCQTISFIGFSSSSYVDKSVKFSLLNYLFWNLFRHCFLFVYILLLQCAHFVWYNDGTRIREPTEAETRRYELPLHGASKSNVAIAVRSLGNFPGDAERKVHYDEIELHLHLW